MGSQATITSKGQMTVPKSVRDALNIQPGDKCYVWVSDGQMIVVPRNKSLVDLVGILGEPSRGKGATIEDLSAAAIEAATDHVVSPKSKSNVE